MLGFFSKLFKSKTPAPDTQAQPENAQNTAPEAANHLPADSETQPENATVAAETTDAAAEPTPEQATKQNATQPEPAAQPETVETIDSANAATAEQQAIAVQRQPENTETIAAPENQTIATAEQTEQPENAVAEIPQADEQGQPENPASEPAAPSATRSDENATAAQEPAAQGQPENAVGAAAEQDKAVQSHPTEPAVRNWTMTAVAEKPNSWASVAEQAQYKSATAETPAVGQPENAVSEATETDVATQGQPENHQTAAPSEQQPENVETEAEAKTETSAVGQPENTVSEVAEADVAAQGQPENQAAAPSEPQPETVEQPENTPPEATTETQETTAPQKLGWAARLKQGLTKSRNHMAKSLAGVFGGGQIDEDLYEELETVLLTSDMGIEATEQLMNEVRDRVSLKGLKDGNELRQALKDAVYDLLKPLEQPLAIPANGEPFVIMLAGINGAGKTTSIGKLAKYFQAQGKSVILAAGDTFRAAAREQLQEWGERNGVTVISQAKGDSAAVCFDAVEAAKARKIDIVLADTAGRLPTQLHLMEEIKKVKRVLQKSMPNAPHEIIVVLDANIGQNAVNQVVAFDDALGVTGLIVTKLDGTAKGGVLAALASSRAIPVRYIGVGESIDDLRPFNAKDFVDALLD